MTARIEWPGVPGVVVVVCDSCGWAFQVHVDDAPLGYAERLAERHVCVDVDEADA